MSIAGYEFAPEYKQGKVTLEGLGATLCRFRINRVMAVAFYLKEKTSPRDALDTDAAKRIEIVFLQKIKKKELFDEFLEGMQSSVDPALFDQLTERLKVWEGFFFDMDVGDRLAITYFPSQGSTMTLNGTDLITLEGGDFAFAFYSVFIGMKPLDVRAKTRLLGPQRKS